MNKILVTGGAGYIGSHTVVELQQQGFEVIIVDDLSNSQLDVLEGIENISGVKPTFHQFDLCDRDRLYKLLSREKEITSIIHFAANKAVGESVQNPLKYYRNNLQSLVNILQGMQEFKIPNLVFSSSCTVYGQPEKLPVTENSPVQPAASPYGNTKQVGEEIIIDTCTIDKSVNAISLRYFNPVGAHESAEIGELPLGVPNNLVPFITQTAAGIREQIQVFGDDYNTKDGSAVRDYIHVVDLAKAHVIALERMINKNQAYNYEYFNLGTGNGYSVLEVVKSFEKVNDLKLNYKIVDRRAGDVEQVYADTNLANNVLGWKAELGIDDMMKSAWNWEKKIRGID